MNEAIYTFKGTDAQMHFLLMLAANGIEPASRAPCSLNGVRDLIHAGFVREVKGGCELTATGRRFIAIT